MERVTGPTSWADGAWLVPLSCVCLLEGLALLGNLDFPAHVTSEPTSFGQGLTQSKETKMVAWLLPMSWTSALQSVRLFMM